MPKNHIITGLDIGSSIVKTLTVVKNKDEETLEVLAFSEEDSAGIRKGIIINPVEVSNLILASIEKIQPQVGQKINSVFVNIGGGHIFSTSSRGLVSVSRADQKISPEDVDRVLQAAQTISLPSNREILEVFPKEYIIDGERGIKEVLGMQGVRLEAEVLVLCGFAPYLKNLNTAILNSGLQINDRILGILASSRAVLTPKEKELGSLVLDIGAGTTEMAVFEEGELFYASILPIGSGHITSDIAMGLKCDFDIAEKIKLEFGSCLPRGKDKKNVSRKNERIELEEGDSLNLSQKQLTKIIEARVSEIFKEVNKELKKISKQGVLPAGVILTGGGARMPGIREAAKKELKLSCRIGTPQGFNPTQENPALSTVCGLVLSGADLESERSGWLDNKLPSSIPGKGVGSGFKKVFKFLLP